jgi:hypothetical protein
VLKQHSEQVAFIVIFKNNAVLIITIMTRGCESKQAHSRCQSHKQNRIIFGNDYINGNEFIEIIND